MGILPNAVAFPRLFFYNLFWLPYVLGGLVLRRRISGLVVSFALCASVLSSSVVSAQTTPNAAATPGPAPVAGVGKLALADFQYGGSGYNAGEYISLLGGYWFQHGYAYWPVKFDATKPFVVSFEHSVAGWADGTTMVLGNNLALGSEYGGLWYGGVGKSVALEMDLYPNWEFADDQRGCHIGLDVNGSMVPDRTAQPTSPYFCDGAWHKFDVEMDPVAKTFAVKMDGKQYLSGPLDLSKSLVNGHFYVWFTATVAFSRTWSNIRNVTVDALPGSEPATLDGTLKASISRKPNTTGGERLYEVVLEVTGASNGGSYPFKILSSQRPPGYDPVTGVPKTAAGGKATYTFELLNPRGVFEAGIDFDRNGTISAAEKVTVK